MNLNAIEQYNNLIHSYLEEWNTYELMRDYVYGFNQSHYYQYYLVAKSKVNVLRDSIIQFERFYGLPRNHGYRLLRLKSRRRTGSAAIQVAVIL